MAPKGTHYDESMERGGKHSEATEQGNNCPSHHKAQGRGDCGDGMGSLCPLWKEPKDILANEQRKVSWVA